MRDGRNEFGFQTVDFGLVCHVTENEHRPMTRPSQVYLLRIHLNEALFLIHRERDALLFTLSIERSFHKCEKGTFLVDLQPEFLKASV